MRPTGAIQMAELASRPRSLIVRRYVAAMLGLNAAVENHIRKHQKKPTVAIPSCSTLWPRINVCSAGRSGDPSHPRKEREPQATNVADHAATDPARRLSRFHLEIGEG